MKTIEEEMNDKESQSWIRRAFKEEWKTMGNHLIACATSLGASIGFSYMAPDITDSDVLISGVATALDMVGYWGIFLPQLFYRDKNKMKDKQGNYQRDKVMKKVGEYASYVGVLEGAYAITRFGTQYMLQKEGWDPVTASAVIQTTAIAFFTVALPPIRYGVRQISEK